MMKTIVHGILLINKTMPPVITYC